MLHLLLILATAALETVLVTAVSLPQDDSLFKEFGNLLGNAIRELTGEDRPQAVVAFPEMAEEAEQTKQTSEKDQADFRERLTLHSAVVQTWVIGCCQLSPEQQTQLAQIATAQVDQHCADMTNQRDQANMVAMLPRTMPLLFARLAGTDQPGAGLGGVRQSLGNAAGSGGPALLFSQSLLEHIRADVLTDGQKELLTAALDERVQAARKAYAAYLAALIDSELFLTTEQLATITKQFEELDATKLHPLYSFQPYNYYIPYQSLATLLNAKPISDCLVKQQRGRLEDLQRAGDGGMNLTFMSNTGPLEWQRQLTEAGSTGRQMLLRAAELRIAFLERELKLPDEQLDRLRTASKGAAVQSLDDWKETAQQTIAQMEQQMAQFQGNFGFGTQALDVNSLDSNEVWTYAMSEATGSESSKLLDRGDVLHDAMAGALTALLDDELWLTAEQRASLRTMVGKSLPNKSNPAQNQEYIRELILLAYPLFRTNTDQRTAMLTDTQQAIWTKMQSYFHWQKANQYVQIQLRNGGGSFGFMLPE